ncbi:MAG: apolipoprotein N-acyltransferase [Alphaproteobacteria bacterium]
MAAESVARRWRERGLALLAGAALPLAFAPLDLVPLAFLSPAILFGLWRNASPRRAFETGLLFGLGQFGVGVSWVYVAIHDVGGSPAWLAAGLTALFIAFLALYPGLAGWLSVRLRPRRPGRAWLLLIVPAVWVLVEWLRGWLLTGFTWLQLGYSQIDTPLANLASWLGVYGVSWAVALGAAALVWLVTERGRQRVAALGLLAGIPVIALLAGQLDWSRPAGKPLRVALVQGNVPQSTKWDPAALQVRLDRYASLTRQHWDRDLILWPENALTLFYHDLAADYLDPLAAEARRHGTDLVVGVPVLDPATDRYYTTLTRLGNPPQSYKKRHLVPFGEFIPLESWLRGLIGFFDLPMSGFSAGAAKQPQLVAAGQPLAPTVCYEDAFGEEVIDFLPRATLLVNGSNNAWYGDSFAPHQHLQISRMRTVETARPLLRVTTNGISALVDHRGRILARSPQFETWVLSGEVQPRQGATLYVRVGNTLIVSLLVLLAVAGWLPGWRDKG